MRIASFNVENLFSRVRAMNMDSWDDGKEVLAEYSHLNTILQKANYSPSDKKAIIKALGKLGLSRSDESKFVILRQNHGRLLKRPKTGELEVVADGRGGWIGWLELKTEATNEVATQMLAKVINDVNADVLAVVEAEDRVALKHFNDQILKSADAAYDGIMLIDGNDERGIDVGILTATDYKIDTIVSHVDDEENGSLIFSRDCPEYLVRGPQDAKVLVLVNHFKSKGYGSQTQANARRKRQAQRVREIYDLRRSQGMDMIAVVGDFNDTPGSDPLSPLLSNGSDLKDIFDHPQFQVGERLGTFGNCTESNKIDYILLSPALFQRMTTGGVWRKGMWGGKNGTLFPHYDEMTEPMHAASDHAAIWVDVEL